MKLNYITFMVRDLEKTIAFYQELAGLKVIRRFNPGMGEIAFMADKEGDTNLEFVQFENFPKVETSGMTMSFQVEGDLGAVREKAISMGYEPSEIVDRAPKPAHFTLKDCDGIDVEFSV